MASKSETELIEKEFLMMNDVASWIEIEIYPFWKRAVEEKYVLGRLHHEWSEIERTHQKTIILAPRDHTKTFFWGHAVPLHKCRFGLVREVMIIQKTARLARGSLQKINELLELPTLEFLKPNSPKTWNKNEIVLSNGSKISVWGFYESKRGEHPGLIVLDDPIDEDVIYSEELNKKSIEYYSSQIVPMAEPKTMVRFIGTLQRQDDIYNSQNKKIYYFKSYDSIVDEDKRITLFPQKWNWKRLMLRKREICNNPDYGEQFWLKEYRNQVVDFRGELFKQKYLKRFTVLPAGHFITYQSWDFADKAKRSSAYSACVTFKKDEFGNIFVSDAFRTKINSEKKFYTVQEQYKKWLPNYDVIESKGQSALIENLIKYTSIPIRPLEPVKDKVQRAMIIVPLWENGKIYVQEGLDDFIAEMLSFPRGKYKDQVDAFANGLKIAIQQDVTKIYFGDEDLESEEDKKPLELPHMEHTF